MYPYFAEALRAVLNKRPASTAPENDLFVMERLRWK
jgi:hypothetical protein